MANINTGIIFDTMATLASSFKKKTPVMGSYGPNVMPANVMDNSLLRYEATDWVAQVISEDGTVTISRGGNMPSPIRFLQWGQNCCTGMELDTGARAVFSGPFSGCSFLIAKDPNSNKPVMLHSNDNSNQGAMNRANTIATQMDRANRYLGIYHNATQPLYHCSYEEMGMVPSWIFAVDTHGDQRSWDVYCVNLVDGGVAPYRRLGSCFII